MTALNIEPTCRWLAFGTTGDLEQAALKAILEAAQHAISERGNFHIVLAGGNTPRRIYESLRYAQTNWSAWHVYYGDERCLPTEDSERNSLMAARAWLHHVPIPAVHIHPIPAELGAEIAASGYAEITKGIEQFDLVLLGLGEDGHTASLFPNHEWGNTPDSPEAIAVHDAPKPPPDRVSLSAHRLCATRQLIFLVSGESKRRAVKVWRNGESIPASAIVPVSGVDIYIENALLQD